MTEMASQNNDGYDGYMCMAVDSIFVSNGVTILIERDIVPAGACGLIYLAVGVSGKQYVGQTVKSLLYRAKEHCRNAFNKNNNGYDSKFYRAIRKYRGQFKWVILEKDVPYDQLNEREIVNIAALNTYKKGYNSTTGGEGTRGCKISEEHKRSLSKHARERNMGSGNPMFGKEQCEKTKKKIGEKHKGKLVSVATRNKSSDALRASKYVHRKPIAVYKFDTSELVGEFDSITEFCNLFGADPSKISACLAGKRKSHMKYRFEYRQIVRPEVIVTKDGVEIGRWNSASKCAKSLSLTTTQVRYGIRIGREFAGLGMVFGWSE
jgi:group I intron endonuclease